MQKGIKVSVCFLPGLTACNEEGKKGERAQKSFFHEGASRRLFPVYESGKTFMIWHIFHSDT